MCSKKDDVEVKLWKNLKHTKIFTSLSKIFFFLLIHMFFFLFHHTRTLKAIKVPSSFIVIYKFLPITVYHIQSTKKTALQLYSPMNCSIFQIQGNNASTFAVMHQQIHGKVLDEVIAVVTERLSIKCV